MGSVHIWLKLTYIVVISLIAIISLLLLGLVFFSLGKIHQQEEVDHVIAAHFTYIFVFVIFVLTIFGAFGVWKEKKWALIVFAVGMTLISLLTLMGTVVVLVAQPKIAEDMKKHHMSLLPLVNATEVLDAIQTELECCGIESYHDWNSSIPESCLCNQKPTNPCVAAPRNSNLFNDQMDDVMIYEKGCLPYIIKSKMSKIRIELGLTVGILLLWVLSIVLCIAILCQL